MDFRNLLYFLAALSAAVLIYIYYGYYAILKMLALQRHPARPESPEALPTITVLVTAHNEEAVIAQRITNILASEYERDRFEILIASDGSTDRTDSIASQYASRRVRLFRPKVRAGKSNTQNEALKTVASQIVVFTDAQTRFSADFLREIVLPFSSSRVGAVDGHLLFQTSGSDQSVAQAQAYYWRQELMIRQLESALGILAVASGACFAVRTNLIGTIPSTVGEDCTVPLDVARAGYRIVHQPSAHAFDTLDSTSTGEFRSRVRMTLRNLQGTLLYRELLNPLKHPGYAWALWSHKLLRWFSPLFVLIWISSGFLLLLTEPGNWPVALPQLLLATCSVVLLLYPPLRGARGLRIVWSFALANAGFAVGVVRALAGRTITTYRN